MRFLILADSQLFGLMQALEEQGHRYDFFLADDAREAAREYQYDMIVLAQDHRAAAPLVADLRGKLPKAGLMVLLPEVGHGAPRSNLLQAGADDVVGDLTGIDEIIARCIAIYRRRAGAASSCIDVGGLIFDLDRMTATVHGACLDLSASERSIVEALVARRGSLVTRDTLYDLLYGAGDKAPDPKVIDVFICKLRAKLTAAGLPADLISTVWGRGYVMDSAKSRAHDERCAKTTPTRLEAAGMAA